MARDLSAGRPTPLLVRMSDVNPVPLRWLWPDRVPLGKLTLIAGDPGRGKSLLTIDIAARVTTGRAFPDGARCCDGAPGAALFISAEDDLADTVRPRLDAAGADPSRVLAMQGVVGPAGGGEQHVTLRDIDAIARAIDELPDTRLVVIDPISAYLGEADDHKNSAVRGLLAPLCRLASDRGVAIVAVTHLRKGDGPAMYRSMGSLGFVATARCAWLVTKHPLDPDLCAIARVKGNVGRDPGGLAYRVVSGGTDDAAVGADASRDGARGGGGAGAPWIQWQEGRVDVEMDTTPWGNGGGGDGSGGGSGGGALEQAKEWLRDVLREGAVGVKELRDRAEGEGMSWRTVERAKADLGAEYTRTGGVSIWELPAIPPSV